MLIRSALWVCALATQVEAQPLFENRSEPLGLAHQYSGGWEFFVGGGVATFDCDGDHFPELFIAGGEGPAVLLRNTTAGRDDAVTFTADTPDILALQQVIGAYPLDVDSDGFLDLFIMRVGENRLLKGGADCTFSEFPDMGFDGGTRWTTAFSATWEVGNALPTLATGNYVDRENPDGPFMACDRNILHRPVNGRYRQIPLSPAFCPLSMLFTDWGRKGRQDLRISNDRHYYVRGGAEQMWAMEATPRLYTKAEGWQDYSLWGMGIASRDITGDGVPEVFLSSMGDQKLQFPDTAVDGPAYHNAAYELGVTAQRPYTGGDGRPSTGWQIEFGDVDNDGRDDVFIAKGNVEQMPDSATADPNNLLMQGAEGHFTEHGLTAGIATMARSRGAALADFNLDGRLDLVVVNRRAPVEVYQNVTPAIGHWLLLDLRQNGVNTRAVGGWIEVRNGPQLWSREITVGGGHASGNAALVHFGLGQADKVDLRVVWPDGATSDWVETGINRILRLQRKGDALDLAPL